MLVGVSLKPRRVHQAAEIFWLPDEPVMGDRHGMRAGPRVHNQVRPRIDPAVFLGGAQAVAQALVVDFPRLESVGMLGTHDGRGHGDGCVSIHCGPIILIDAFIGPLVFQPMPSTQRRAGARQERPGASR